MRKFADKQRTDKKDGIQTLRPLYLSPLWILEGVGQYGLMSNSPFYNDFIFENVFLYFRMYEIKLLNIQL